MNLFFYCSFVSDNDFDLSVAKKQKQHRFLYRARSNETSVFRDFRFAVSESRQFFLASLGPLVQTATFFQTGPKRICYSRCQNGSCRPGAKHVKTQAKIKNVGPDLLVATCNTIVVAAFSSESVTRRRTSVIIIVIMFSFHVAEVPHLLPSIVENCPRTNPMPSHSSAVA